LSSRRFGDAAGVSLIEIMIAMSILATVLVALGGLMFQVARHTRQSAAAGYSSAAVTSAGAWAQTLPWDSLPGAAGCVDDTIGQFTYSRCTTVANRTSRLRRVTVVISPTGVLTPQPDTIVVDRHKPVPSSTLNLR
jgi:prepilin-type N-terminal cleavage/methylation domain-containing protein